ncbi:MAG: Nickel transport protein NikQ [Pelotomaculum sp. PtaU1.Bin035]|nr:MAG: Nickel transport protein NikQ [Pelotomaculum sp. PtaU1.Bin035]
MSTDLPEWLLARQEPFQHGDGIAGGKSIRRGFVEKSVDSMSLVFRESFFAERLASRPGLLQGIDPRVKVLTTILLIIVAGLARHPTTLLALNLWILWVAKVSRVPLPMYLKRVWLAAPLFTGIIVFPSIFNVVYPGDPLLILINFSRHFRLGPWTVPETLAVTYQGVWGALVLILRVGASVSLAVLLALTTRWQVLLKALNMVFVPQVFIVMLEMSCRYIYLFLQTTSEMFVARRSRTVSRTSTQEQRCFVSGSIGALWNKAYILSGEIHAAMVSRGYTGTPKTLVSFQISRLDWLWSLFVLAVSLFFLGGDRIVAW